MSTLVKSNGPSALRSMMEDFWNTDRFFEQPHFTREMLPAVNIRETEKSYELELAAPGFKKDDFKISTENGVITISAETSMNNEEKKNNYTRQEFSCSSFARTFALPDNIMEDKITASYHDGLLSVDLKKSNKSLPSKKQIKVE